jgi:hypothetical protein
MVGYDLREMLFENSKTRSARSRGTLGKLSRNSSSVSPASRLVIRASMGTRVPEKTGVCRSRFQGRR